MNYKGNILKMTTKLANPVSYSLPVGNDIVEMNPLIGCEIEMQFAGQINCISCGKITKTSFNQGFCYNCLQTAPESGESVIRPELSKSHFGISRDMDWAVKNDLIEHIVYLAVANELKVGVTRGYQIPTRWIDQGACYVIKLAKTPNRHIAGIIEIYLKKFIPDRTNWQSMLTNAGNSQINLREEKMNAMQRLPAELQKYYCEDDQVVAIEYPLNELPDKVKSIGFDKTPLVRGVLKGIKGQYLVFQDNTVLNIRKHCGYFIRFNCLI